MNIPDNLRYSSDHEWVSAEEGRARIGITDFAQDALGDVVYVELPAVGATVELGASMGEVESTKSVSDIYAPISGTVLEINDVLDSEPNKINDDPYGEGWLCVISVDEAGQLDQLLDAEAYQALTAE
jgi:glycine cleavage system H protein